MMLKLLCLCFLTTLSPLDPTPFPQLPHLQDEVQGWTTDEHAELQKRLQENFWNAVDRNGRTREKAPALPDKLQLMTQSWIEKLTAEELQWLMEKELSKEVEKQARELEKKYRNDAKDLVAQYQLAEKLARKVTDTHWKGMEKLNVTRESFPEYTLEYDRTVLNWFHARTIEDLSIFEKPRPKPNERERGEKITAELLKAIEEVQQKHQSKWQID